MRGNVTHGNWTTQHDECTVLAAFNRGHDMLERGITNAG